MDRQKGTVSWFDAEQGQGFIEPDQGGEDVLVEAGDVGEDGGTLEAGDRVSYVVEMGSHGPRAREVERLTPAETSDGGPDASVEARREEEAEHEPRSPTEDGVREAGEGPEPLDERFRRRG